MQDRGKVSVPVTTAPVAHVVHVAQGRLRLRVPSMRGDEVFFSNLVRSMEHVESVGNVHANSVTGSVLIEGSSLTLEQLRDLSGKQLWLEIPGPPSDAIEAVSSPVEASSPPAGAGLRRLAPLAVLSLAAIQVAQGQLLPSAFSLLVYALELARSRGTSLTRAAPFG